MQAPTGSADRPDAMTTATESEAKKPSQSLLRNYGQALNMHMQEIWDATSADLELQMVVVAVIRECKELKAAATENLQTVGEIMTSAMEGRKRKRDDDDSGLQDLPVAPEGPIRRGQHIYGHWVAKLLDELLFFLEPTLFDKKTLKNMGITVKYECL
ncbi:unnamed protein product [Prorocentrum cordatum]|uniref:Uncharacterized protein n=1 Tax=Prorocentrum cordatum TaxID=2364126 RepID=A0ABN9VRR4_9DINO|nr:unnamed protein product [Polarella glacialis]